MGKINVINKASYKPNKEENSISINIDRTSVLGNPYIHKGPLDKPIVIDKYKDYFYKEVKKDNSKINLEIKRIVDLLQKYDTVNLACWCAPGRCHGDIIKDYIDKNYI